MDAGSHVEWFGMIESCGWKFMCQVKKDKTIKLNDEMISMQDYMQVVGSVLFTKRHQYSCSLVTARKDPKGRKKKEIVN